MNIGITFVQKEPGDSIWTNGIKLNALILAKMFIQSSHKVYLVNRYDIKLDQTTPWDIEKYPLISEETALEYNLDIIFILGGAISDEYIKRFKYKNPKSKVVAYHCGNHYILEAEKVLFGKNLKENKPMWNQLLDEIWIIPQQEYHNLYYVHTFSKTPVRVVPFVWDPEHVQKVSDNIDSSNKFNKVQYLPNREKKRISVFEPNINIIKYAMIPIHISEWSYWDIAIKSRLDFLSVTNGIKLLENHEFNGHVKYLDIFKDKKIYMEARYNTPYFLADHTDIVLSHQWENPLNYSYLDALYFGYPLVHNAKMIQDMGYYYPDFNIELGSKQLKKAIIEHDLNYEEYNKKHQILLNRYMSTNKDLVEQYNNLLNSVMYKKSNFIIRSGYDWKTNSISEI